ncbi:conserved exported hypothetical protein [metagenome]|uniref:Putative Flp pilus-assembly TadG-like N-terminal domain-containing protein n=1 Tax=metagenome TaxID=256318 RepID=A0A2P2CF76_9ZZZZ
MSDQRGAATVLALALAAVLMLVGLAGAWVAGVIVSHRRAQSAADLSALAGAQAAQHGSDACSAARATAASNHASLFWCDSSGADVQVGVVVPGPRLAGRTPRLVAHAHAGPQW